MGLINKLIPKQLKPISRDIGFCFNSYIYKIEAINKKIHPFPVFILGNQKSGTSAIAALLGELTNKKTAIDLFYSGYKPKLFLEWKTKSLSTLEFINKNKVEFSYELIKEPHLSVFFDELKQQYPNSKFIMIIRNPFDNIRSILDRLNIDGDKAKLNKREKNQFFHSWSLLLDNCWISGNKSQYIEVLAERWNIICNTYIENKKNIFLIKYEDFIQNKETTIRNLANQLKLRPKKEITHLLQKQYQPAGKKRNINIKDFFGEENYQKISKICGEKIKEIGY